MNPADNNELLWKQYELHLNLYKDYLGIALKINIFQYAITGAIVTYYIAHTDMPIMRLALIFPILMNGFFAILFGIGSWLSWISRKEVRRIGDLLGAEAIPEVGILTILLAIFAALFILVALGLMLLLCLPCISN